MTKNRTLASLISNDTSKIKTVYTDSDSIVTSASLGVTAAAGTATYSSADTLPVSADNGDQALVTSTNRLYIYTNGGWYNIALINSTPYWSSEASSSYVLSTTGTSTVITILAVDSEGIPITYTVVADSDFNQIATITKDSDNGRTFTITPTDSENGAAVSGSGTVTFKASDGVNLVSTLSTFNLTFTSIIENSNYTTLLVKADSAGTDNQVDASTNGFTITEVGNITSTALSPYHPGGYSTSFDGNTGDYLDISSSNNFIFGTGAFTVECWFYSTDLNHNGGAQYPHLICINSYTNGVYLRPHYNGTSYNVYVGGTSYTFSTTIEENVWTHVAVVRDGSGNLKLFENGIQIGSTVTGVNYNISTNSSNNRIGAAIHTAGEEFKGYIKDVRVTNTAVYTTNFTLPTETLTAIANTQLLTCHLPYIADGSSNNHTITIVGNTSTKRFGPYDYEAYTKADYGGSVYFDGTGDYLTVPDGAYKTYGSGDFTIEMWFYTTAAFPNNWLAADANSAGTTSTMSVGIFLESPNVKAQVITNTGTKALNGTNSVKQDMWNHVAVTRYGTALTLWINGVASATVTIGGSETVNDSIENWVIGRCGGYDGVYFNGYISDFRLVKGTAVYTSAFTPPTAPLTAIANTQLLTCTNKNDILDTGSGTLLTKFGNLAASNTQRKFTTSSAIALDGTGDYLKYEDLKGTTTYGDFTIECFIYVTSLSNTMTVWDWRAAAASDPSGANFGIGQILATSGYVTFYDGTTSQTGNIGVPVNTWTHIAWVRNNGTISVYVDGVSSLSFTNTSVWQHCWTNYTPTIFANVANSAEVIGYVQGLRFAKEYARYTANFTPPTTEFTA